MPHSPVKLLDGEVIGRLIKLNGGMKGFEQSEARDTADKYAPVWLQLRDRLFQYAGQIVYAIEVVHDLIYDDNIKAIGRNSIEIVRYSLRNFDFRQNVAAPSN